ncbi:MAG: LytTR family DNA-binding domain-containing protein [Rikenellaceae bacterium]
MKCVAIDDEPAALMIIKQFCERIGGIDLLTFTNPLVGIEQVKCDKPDLVFLDVEMGVVNGVDLARQLPENTFLVFSTAYARFALDGFELDAVDFLHKPFSFSRFEKTIQKVTNLLALQCQTSVIEDFDDEITVKVEYKNVKVKLSEVMYIQAMDNYVRIHLSSSKSVLSQMCMKTMLDMLPKDRFVRVHKSFIVSMKRVDSYNRSKITLSTMGVTIPIGRTYVNEFAEVMKTENH